MGRTSIEFSMILIHVTLTYLCSNLPFSLTYITTVLIPYVTWCRLCINSMKGMVTKSADYIDPIGCTPTAVSYLSPDVSVHNILVQLGQNLIISQIPGPGTGFCQQIPCTINFRSTHACGSMKFLSVGQKRC